MVCFFGIILIDYLWVISALMAVKLTYLFPFFFFFFLLLSCGVISKLRNVDSGADESKYSTLIDCVCHWGQVGHIMELAGDWLSDMLTPRKVCIHQGVIRIHKFIVLFFFLKKELLQCYVFLLQN